jgi:hypothetical protein
VETLQRRLALVLAVVSFAAAAAAFLYAQVEKTAAAPIYRTNFDGARFFSPNGDKSRDRARLVFRLRASQKIDATVIDAGGRPVRTLVDGESRQGDVKLAWDGRDDAGQPVPDGVYRVRVHLHEDDTTITLSGDVTLDTTAPTVTASPPADGRIVPNLAGSGRYAFRATADEPVTLRLAVWRITLGGRAERVFLERATAATRARTLAWSGEVGSGKPVSGQASPTLTPGSYVVGWIAEDRAGNRVQAPAKFAPGGLAPAAVVGVDTVSIKPKDEVLEAYPGPTADEHQLVGSTQPWPAVEPQAPGVQAFHAAAGGYDAWAPIAVGGPDTLVVVPTYSWALRNTYDGNGDGYPDVRSGTASLAWPWDPATKGRLERLGRVLEPVLRPGAYGAITDAQLDSDGVPAGTKRLVLAHVRAWTDGLADRLRAFQDGGGELVLRKSLLDRHVARDGDAIRELDDQVLALE